MGHSVLFEYEAIIQMKNPILKLTYKLKPDKGSLRNVIKIADVIHSL